MKSSFQELMELVAKDIESKDELALLALLERLIGLRESFKRCSTNASVDRINVSSCSE